MSSSLSATSRQQVLGSEARTATTTSPAFANHQSRGALLVMSVTAAAATPTVTPKIQASADGGTTWADYLVVTAGLTGTGTTTYLLYPGVNPTEDGAITETWNLPLPRSWRVVATHADADSITYSINVMYL